MKMKSRSSGRSGRLVAQARPVEVGDVVDLRIEQVEEVEGEPRPSRDPQARLRIEDCRRGRSRAVVLDQRARSEGAHVEAGPPGPELVEGDSCRRGPPDGA